MIKLEPIWCDGEVVPQKQTDLYDAPEEMETTLNDGCHEDSADNIDHELDVIDSSDASDTDTSDEDDEIW